MNAAPSKIANGTRLVFRTGAVLFGLWALSFALSYVHLGDAALPVALGVAALKACLVVVFFMELLRESFSMKLTVVVAGVLLATLIGLVIADYATRETPPLAPFEPR